MLLPTLNVRDKSQGPIGCESYPSWGQHSPQRLAQLRAMRLLLQVNFCLLNNPLRFLRVRLHRMRFLLVTPSSLYSSRKLLLTHCFWSWHAAVFPLHFLNWGKWHFCWVATVLQLVSRRRPVALSVTVILMHSSSLPSFSGRAPSLRRKSRLYGLIFECLSVTWHMSSSVRSELNNR